MLEQIPFLPNCEDEDSDEDDELDSVQHKKQRVKVSAWPRGRVPPIPQGNPLLCAQQQGTPGTTSVVCVWPDPIPESLFPCLSNLRGARSPC